MAWNRPSNDGRANTPGSPRRGGTPRPTVAVIVGAVCAALAAWWLFPNSGGRGATRPAESKRGLIKEVAPSLSTKADKVAQAEPQKDKEPEIDPSVAKTNGIVSALNPEGRLFISIETNNTGMIRTLYRRANGTMVRVIDFRRPTVKLSAADQLLNMVTAHADGGPPAPVDPNDRSMDAVFKKALEKPLEIKADDSDATRALKERLNAARADMDALMNQTGASFSEIIAEHQRTAKENAAILNEAQSLINESLKNGDKDGAATIYQQFSGRLEQMGVTGLTLDPVLDDGDADE